MPPQAYVLVMMFAAVSGVVGWLAVRLAARHGGPSAVAAHVLPVAAAFGALYLVGHRWGLVLGPEIGILGMNVAFFGDALVGFAVALVVAVAQALVWRALRATRRPPAGSAEA